jgi:CheY-like chemotaxis protein
MRAEQKNVFFAYEKVDDLPLGIEIDEKRLRQVLLNLLGNVIKFIDKGQVTLKVSQQEGSFRFEVTDTGVGMTDEELEIAEKIEQRRISAYKGETQTALIVDDYPENRLILRQMLENIGFKVIEANDGKQGVKLADKANIIFMDLVMPVMNGFEAVEIIRKDFKDLPIIAISANVFEADKQKSLQAGCNAFLPKPIEE